MGDRIAVGIIRKAHGVRGEASVEPWTSSVDRFHDLRSVTLVSPDESETRTAEIESFRPHTGRALVKFAGIAVRKPRTAGAKLFFALSPLMVSCGLSPFLFAKSIIYEFGPLRS